MEKTIALVSSDKQMIESTTKSLAPKYHIVDTVEGKERIYLSQLLEISNVE